VSAEKDVLAVAAELVSAFGQHDTARYFSFFAPDATFIFYNHPDTLTSREDYRALWSQWETEEGFRVLSCVSSHQEVRLLTPDCAVFTHHVNTRASLGGETIESRERETIVFSYRESQWFAVHEHLSPQEQEAP
jgi:uncharacterized protein (TIGR02246 family)